MGALGCRLGWGSDLRYNSITEIETLKDLEWVVKIQKFS